MPTSSRAIIPVRWQSSQGPLFVRTVWVNGLRHAVLSADDPLFQCRSRAIPSSRGRPGSPSSVSTFTSSSSGSAHNCDDLEHCLVKFQLVLTSNQSSNKSSTTVLSSHHSSSSRSRQDSEPCCGEETSSVHAASVARHYRRPCLSYEFQSSSEEERDQEPVEDDPWLFSDVESLLPDLQLNPLSERVLQWLDLVGKTAGILDDSEHAASASHFGKRNGKGRPISRHFSTPTPPLPSKVETERISPSRRPLQRQRSNVGYKVPTVTLHTDLETAVTSTSLGEEPLRISVRGLKTFRRKRQAFNDVRAVIDETDRRVSAVKQGVCFEPSDPSSTSRQPPSANSEVSSHLTAPSPSRPQLHIFMPTLLKGRPTLCHQDAADVSETDSYCSETWP